MKVGIVAAMESERTLVEQFLENREKIVSRGRTFCIGSAVGNSIVLGETGIGKVNAAIGAAALIEEFRPDVLLSTGVAGGLDTSLQVMDVVVASETVYHDVDCGPGNEYGQVQGFPPRFAADRRLLAAARGIAVDGVRIAVGLMASGDKFISGDEQVSAIKAHFPAALAVDMESGALSQVCHALNVPFLSCRILSDVPGAAGGRFTQYEDFWKTMAQKATAVTEALLAALPESLFSATLHQ